MGSIQTSVTQKQKKAHEECLIISTSAGGKFRKKCSRALINSQNIIMHPYNEPDFQGVYYVHKNKSVLRESVEFILQLKGSLAANSFKSRSVLVGSWSFPPGYWCQATVFEHEEHTYSHTVLLAKLLTQLKTTISLEEMKNVAYGICQSIFSPLNY